MRILVCSANIPQPVATKGLSASMMTLYGYVDQFRKRGWPMLHVLVLDKRADPALLEAYRKDIEESGGEVIAWVMPYATRPRKHLWSDIEAETIPEDVRERIRAFRPDAGFCLDVFAAAALHPLPEVPLLVQVHDPKFQTLWYHALYETMEHPLHALRLPMDWLRVRAWKRFYRDTLLKVARVIAIAKSTEYQLKLLGVRSHYVPMSWPASDRPANVPPKPSMPTFLFLGNLSGVGSRSALHFLLERVYPALIKKWGKGGFAIFICGPHSASPWTMNAIALRPEVKFLGYVDDVESLMLSCHAVLAPIDVKVGNRTRILTAMSLGVPVIAHSNTALGNPSLVDGETCYLANDPQTFVERMERAFGEGSEIDRICKNAKEAFDTQFAPDAAGALLVKELESIVAV